MSPADLVKLKLFLERHNLVCDLCGNGKAGFMEFDFNEDSGERVIIISCVVHNYKIAVVSQADIPGLIGGLAKRKELK